MILLWERLQKMGTVAGTVATFFLLKMLLFLSSLPYLCTV